MSAQPLLELRGVRKTFGSEVVLRDVDLVVPEHTVTVLIGASGSGKSTLLRCINQLELIDDGLVLFEGVDLADPRADADEIRRRIGIVFQAFNLFPHMTVLDNITLAMRRVQRTPRAEAERTAMDLLARFSLADKAGQYPDRLSGGQQQRAAIVRALALSPRLMLFDEVTSALDPVLVNEVLAVVRDLRADGMTMVIATHEMGFATQVADEVVFLCDGVIVERGAPQQVLHEPSDPLTQGFLARVHEAGRL
ncbi:MAG: ATP-binding cassette domain-containing protein [Frankiales bacterium]|nr:ATP-binding cassette domain-containing protein [Frankiales bacterium]